MVDGGWEPIACVVGYDAAAGQHFILPYEELPVRFPGTGDIFSAVFMGHILRGDALKTADTYNALYHKRLQLRFPHKFHGRRTFADTEFGPPHAPLLALLKERGLAPTIICESAGTQAEDA